MGFADESLAIDASREHPDNVDIGVWTHLELGSGTGQQVVTPDREQCFAPKPVTDKRNCPLYQRLLGAAYHV